MISKITTTVPNPYLSNHGLPNPYLAWANYAFRMTHYAFEHNSQKQPIMFKIMLLIAEA